MAALPDVFDAAQNGDLSQLNSHVVMAPECVARRDDRWVHAAAMVQAVVEICWVNKIVCCCRHHHHYDDIIILPPPSPSFISLYTPLNWAALYGHLDACRLLVRAAAPHFTAAFGC